MIRIPTLKIFDSFLAMDGNHRLKGLKPSIIIMDYINVTKKQINYCQDLSNIYWQSYIKRNGEGYVF